jgi:hypothetical protein
VIIANNLDELHTDANNLNKQTALTEKGELVSGRRDPINNHDILTGSDPQGLYSTAGGDTTCGNWQKSARHMKSGNSSHGSRGCGQEQLKSTGGAGLFYCFLAD